MEKVLDEALKKVEGYLLSIERNTETSRYEIEVGIPKNWIFRENDNINYEVVAENEVGSMIKIFGITDEVVIDDLIEYVNIIVDTNKKIAEMQDEFDKKLEEAKEELVKEVKSFEDELEEVKKQSFSSEEEDTKENPKKRKPVETEGESDEETELIDKIH